MTLRRKLGDRFLQLACLLCATTIPAGAATLMVSASGQFGSGVIADPLAAPNAVWALSFQVDADPAAANADALGFDAPFSNFSYMLNSASVLISPEEIRLFTTEGGGLFTIFFGPETGFSDGMPIPEFTLSGGQMFSGATTNPTIIPGSYPITDALYDDALNFDDEGASGSVNIPSTPEPSAYWLCLAAVFVSLVLRFRQRSGPQAVTNCVPASRSGESPRRRADGRHDGFSAGVPSFTRWAILTFTLSLPSGLSGAQVFTKSIDVAPGVQTFAVASWFTNNCVTSAGVGIYTANVAPQHGTLAFSTQNLPVPGCPGGSPDLPAAVAFYTWTDTTPGASSDSFQLFDILDGVTQYVINISVTNTQAQPGKSLGKPQGKPGQTPGMCPCRTDPIDIGTGNVFEEFRDYQTAGQNTLSLVRYYNSRANLAVTPAPNLASSVPLVSGLSSDWRTTYDRHLELPSATSVVAERADGQRLAFTLSGSTWRPDSDVDYTLTNSGIIWTLTGPDDTVETYSTAIVLPGASVTGYVELTSIRARNGYTQTLNYSGFQLASVTDSYNRTLSFAYNAGLLQTVTTPDGLMITYQYDQAALPSGSGNRLIKVSYSTIPATSQTYLYENAALPWALTGIIDEDGNRYATWTYDATARGLSSQHGTGANLVTIAYDDTTGNRTLTGPLGSQDLYKFTYLQGIPKLTEIDRAATSTTAAATELFTYDANGYVASQTDWNGNQTTFVNNVHGEPTTINEAVGTAVARTTTITYDTTFVHLPKTIVTPGLTSGITYDASGNPLTTTLTDTTTTTIPYSTRGQTRTWTNTWANFLLASTKGPRTDVVELNTFTYDTTGALTTIINALGQTTKITAHTGGGFPLTIVDSNGVTTNLTYDARQRLLTSTVTTSQGPRTTAFTYDAAGNLTKTTLPDSSALTNTYDSAHRLTTITDLFHQNVAYTLDALGDRTQTNLTAVGNRIQRQHSDSFDALGRVLHDIGGVGQTTTLAYDPDGNALTVTDPLGRVTRRAFDALNRLNKITDPNTGITTITYDAHDRPLAVTDPNGNATSYVYDGFGDLIQQTSPDSGKTVYHYDLAGNLTQKIDAAGITTNRSFDALDRVVTTTYPSDASENVAYNYDQAGHGFGIGRLTSLTDAAGSLIRTYDERGNRLSETRISGATTFNTTYSYDAASRISSIKYPSGWTISQTRDVMGRIYQLPVSAPGGAPAGNAITNATYEPFGPLYTLTFGNGVNESRHFDLDYRVTALADAGASAIQGLGYAYDAADNVLSIADAVTPGNSQALGYDVLNRLTSATGGYGSLAYSYDKVGNRLSQTLGAAITTYGYSSSTNRLASITAGSSATPVSYTATGNISSIPPTAGAPAANLTYNAANRLSSVTGVPVAISSMVYDAFGQRFSKANPGANPTVFTYSQDGSLLEEVNNGIATDYIYLNGRPVATVAPNTGKIYFLHDDRLGTPQLATDAGQTVVWSASYQPFGSTGASGMGTITQNQRLPGQYFDGETGFYYNLNRNYAPNLGRYLESDPVGLAGGINLYLYAGANPVQNVDPRGLADKAGNFFGVPLTPSGGGLSDIPSSAFPSPPIINPPLTVQQAIQLLNFIQGSSTLVSIVAYLLESNPYTLGALAVGLCADGVKQLLELESEAQFAASTAITYGTQAAGTEGLGVIIDAAKLAAQLAKVR